MKRDLIAGLSIAVVATITCAAVAFGDDANIIAQQGRAFHPSEITIEHGTTLNFVNQDEFIHQIYVDSPSFNYDSKEQEPGAAPMHIAFPAAGTFAVRCHIHPKMLLIVHVK
jgi:plastocyanin